MKEPLMMAGMVLVGIFVLDRWVQPVGTIGWAFTLSAVVFTVIVSCGVHLYARRKVRS